MLFQNKYAIKNKFFCKIIIFYWLFYTKCAMIDLLKKFANNALMEKNYD